MKVRLPAHFYVLAAIVVVGAALTRSAATPAAQDPQGLSGAQANGGITTLYMMDPLAQSFCFANGQPGLVFQENEVRNHCSDVDVHYYSGSLTLGVEGARIATVVDLGSPAELEKRYGFQDTGGYGQGFASLRVVDGKVVVLKDRDTHTEQDLKESKALFQDGKPLAAAPIQQGHIYLARITERNRKDFARIVKFMVIAYAPEQSVTIRWQLL